MHSLDYHEEAERCRQQALSYLGRPEAPFLLRVAREFDRLVTDKDRGEEREDRSTRF